MSAFETQFAELTAARLAETADTARSVLGEPEPNPAPPFSSMVPSAIIEDPRQERGRLARAASSLYYEMVDAGALDRWTGNNTDQAAQAMADTWAKGLVAAPEDSDPAEVVMATEYLADQDRRKLAQRHEAELALARTNGHAPNAVWSRILSMRESGFSDVEIDDTITSAGWDASRFGARALRDIDEEQRLLNIEGEYEKSRALGMAKIDLYRNGGPIDVNASNMDRVYAQLMSEPTDQSVALGLAINQGASMFMQASERYFGSQVRGVARNVGLDALADMGEQMKANQEVWNRLAEKGREDHPITSLVGGFAGGFIDPALGVLNFVPFAVPVKALGGSAAASITNRWVSQAVSRGMTREVAEQMATTLTMEQVARMSATNWLARQGIQGRSAEVLGGFLVNSMSNAVLEGGFGAYEAGSFEGASASDVIWGSLIGAGQGALFGAAFEGLFRGGNLATRGIESGIRAARGRARLEGLLGRDVPRGVINRLDEAIDYSRSGGAAADEVREGVTRTAKALKEQALAKGQALTPDDVRAIETDLGVNIADLPGRETLKLERAAAQQRQNLVKDAGGEAVLEAMDTLTEEAFASRIAGLRAQAATDPSVMPELELAELRYRERFGTEPEIATETIRAGDRGDGMDAVPEPVSSDVEGDAPERFVGTLAEAQARLEEIEGELFGPELPPAERADLVRQWEAENTRLVDTIKAGNIHYGPRRKVVDMLRRRVAALEARLEAPELPVERRRELIRQYDELRANYDGIRDRFDRERSVGEETARIQEELRKAEGEAEREQMLDTLTPEERRTQAVLESDRPLRSRDEVVGGLRKAFRLPEDQASAVGAILDARAAAWSAQTGRPAEDWFATRIADVRRSGRPSSEALFQVSGDGFQFRSDYRPDPQTELPAIRAKMRARAYTPGRVVHVTGLDRLRSIASDGIQPREDGDGNAAVWGSKVGPDGDVTGGAMSYGRGGVPVVLELSPRIRAAGMGDVTVSSPGKSYVQASDIERVYVGDDPTPYTLEAAIERAGAVDRGTAPQVLYQEQSFESSESHGLLADPNELGFFSKAARLIRTKMPKQQTRRQLYGWLEKNGVSPEEFRWTGLGDALLDADQIDAPITRDEVMDILREDRLGLYEQILGKNDSLRSRQAYRRVAQAELAVEGLAMDRSLWGGQDAIDSVDGDSRLTTMRDDLAEMAKDASDSSVKALQWEIKRAFRNNWGDVWSKYEVYDEAAPDKVLAVYSNGQLSDARDRAGIDSINDLGVSSARAAADDAIRRNQEGGRVDPTTSRFTYRHALTAPLEEVYQRIRNNRALLDAMRELKEASDAFQEIDRLENVMRDAKFEEYTLPGGDNYREIILRVPNETTGGVAYESGHFESNTVAHARVKDREVDGIGKVLFIEEVQSDWHQAARRSGSVRADEVKERARLQGQQGELANTLHKKILDIGIKEGMEKRAGSTSNLARRALGHVPSGGGDQPVRVKTMSARQLRNGLLAIDEAVGMYRADGPEEVRQAIHRDVNVHQDKSDHAYALREEWPERLEQINDAVRTFQEWRRAVVERIEFEDGMNVIGVVEGPWAKRWHEMAMRRLIRRAAEGGYDAIGWTTGATQAKRYDLGEVTDEIQVWRRPAPDFKGDPSFEVYVRGPQGNIINASQGRKRADELPGLLGDSIAKGILDDFDAGRFTKGGMTDGDSVVLRGDRLQVGGLGFAKFYDDILPRYVNKFSKRWGGEVTPAAVGVGENNAWRIVDTISDTVLEEGRYSPMLDRSDPQEMAVFEAARIQSIVEREGLTDVDDTLSFQDMGIPEPVHMLVLPDEMRESVLTEGVPLFHRSQNRIAASVEFQEDGRAIIRALEKPDISSALHEIGHIFRRDLDPEQRAIVEEWAGVQDGTWTVPAEEKFARAFERYLRDGNAPTPTLQRVFQQLKAWFMAIYRSVNSGPLSVKITPELRGVFDELLGGGRAPTPAEAQARTKIMEAQGRAMAATMGEGIEYEGPQLDDDGTLLWHTFNDDATGAGMFAVLEGEDPKAKLAEARQRYDAETREGGEAAPEGEEPGDAVPTRPGTDDPEGDAAVSAEVPPEQPPAPEASPAEGPPPPSVEPAIGHNTVLELPGGQSMEGSYVLMAADDLIPSHDARRGFQPNKHGDKNERDYADPTEGKPYRSTVKLIAGDPRPALLLTDSPTAVDGPPIVTPDRVVLGGNARSQALQLLYQEGGEGAAKYRTAVLEDASKFGFSPDQVEAIPDPVIVRQISAEDAGARGELSRKLNEALTTAKTADTDAVSRGSRLSPEDVKTISITLRGKSIREVLSSPSQAAALMQQLIRAGAFTEADFIGLRDQRGIPNQAGKDVIERTLLGAAIPDVRRMAQTAPAVRNKVIGAMSPIVTLRSADSDAIGFDMDETLNDALDAVYHYQDSGALSFSDLLSQSTMFEEPWRRNAQAIGFARALIEDGPRQFRAKMVELADAATDANTGQGRMFGSGDAIEDVAQALAHHFPTEAPTKAEAEGLFPRGNTVGDPKVSSRGKSPYNTGQTILLGTPSGALQRVPPVLRSVPMPELLKLAKDLMGGRAPFIKKLRGARGDFLPAGAGRIRIDPGTAADPDGLAATLAHEIGHLVDYLDDATLKRGNMLGRLLTLRNFLKGTYAGAFTPGGTVAKNKALRDELKALSMWWKPYDPKADPPEYVKYRESSVELYADALSVWLNNPGEFEARAPMAAKLLYENLDRKPTVLDAYLSLQDFLAGTPEQIARARRADIREGFAKGEEVIRARAEEKRASRLSLIHQVRQILFDKGTPIIDRERALLRRGISIDDEKSAAFALDELDWRDSINHAFLTRVERDVTQPLVDAGLEMDDLGEYMLLRRIVNERTGIANPFGHTPETAAEQLDDLRRILGPRKSQLLDTHIQAFDDMVFELAERATDAGVYNRETFTTVVEPNKGNYAAFAVVDYLDETMPAGIRQQVGTFKEVANPFLATVMKSVSLNRAIELNTAKNTVRDLFQRHMPAEMVKKSAAPGGQPKKPGHGKDHLVVLEDGRPAFYEVDQYVAKAFTLNDIGLLSRLGKAISAPTYKVFHPLYVTLSPSWQVFNIPRDMKRTYKMLSAFGQRGGRVGGTTGFREMLRSYLEAAGPAWKRARKRYDPLIEEMMQAKALDVPFASYDFTADSLQYDRILARYGMVDSQKARSKLGQLVADVFAGVESVGVWTETVPKIAAWNMMTRAGIDGKFRSYAVRNYFGTPNFKKKGLATELTNGMFMYSNVIIQGLRADIAVGTNPKSAGGYWMRSMIQDFLPKMVMRGAKLGLFGAAVKGVMDLVPDYDLANYLVVPMGAYEDENGEMKAVYLRLPHDDTNRVLAASAWLMSRGETKESVAAIVGQSPFGSWSPAIEMASKWKDYAQGMNPVDSFRGREIIGRDSFNAGGWHAHQEMIRWTFDQFGIASVIADGLAGVGAGLGELGDVGTEPVTGMFRKPGDDDEVSRWWERTIDGVPGLERIVKISNRGLSQEQWDNVRMEDEERARFRLSLPSSVRSLVRQRYRLNRLGEERLEGRQLYERQVVNDWYRRSYLPLTREIREAEEAGDRRRSAALRKALQKDTTRANNARRAKK